MCSIVRYLNIFFFAYLYCPLSQPSISSPAFRSSTRHGSDSQRSSMHRGLRRDTWQRLRGIRIRINNCLLFIYVGNEYFHHVLQFFCTLSLVV